MNLLAILAKGGCGHNQTGCQAAKEFTMENTICSNDSQRTYTAEQVARILGVSVRTAYYLCERTTELPSKR